MGTKFDPRILPLDTPQKIYNAASQDKHGFALRFLLNNLANNHPSYTKEQILNSRSSYDKKHISKSNHIPKANSPLEDIVCGTALTLAIKNSNFNAVESLIREGADVNRIDLDGNSPLYMEDKDGNTALHLVSIGTRSLTARILLDAGADAGHLNKENVTPLFAAAFHENFDIVIEMIHKTKKISRERVIGDSLLANIQSIKPGGKIEALFKGIARSDHEFSNEALAILIELNPEIENELEEIKLQSQIERLEENIKRTEEMIEALKLVEPAPAPEEPAPAPEEPQSSGSLTSRLCGSCVIS